MKLDLNQVTGLILAGGEGRRLGGLDKGLMDFEGQPLASRQINWLQDQVGKLLISANRNLDFYHSFDYPVLTDDSETFNGPLQGILQATQHCMTEWLFVVPVDVPLLPQALIKKLCSNINNKDKAYYLRSDEREHFLIMMIHRCHFSVLTEMVRSQKLRVRSFLKAVDAKALNLGIPESNFKNFNSQKDFLAHK